MKGLAIIYKKSTIKRDNGNDICIYTAVALKSGKLEKGEFIDRDNKKYSFINNQKDDEEFVYAFPYFTDIENEKLDLLIEKIENIHNDFDDYTLFQAYDEEGNLVLLASNDNLNTHIEIDASIFGNYLSMLEYEACEDEFEDAEKNNIEIIKKNIYLITDECYKSINESIINQDEQIKKILSIMAKNLFISNVYLNTDIEEKD